MLTVQGLMEDLKLFPAEAKIHAYEGEGGAFIVITNKKGELGYISANENGVTETIVHEKPHGFSFPEKLKPLIIFQKDIDEY